jgi:hypothetical protein
MDETLQNILDEAANAGRLSRRAALRRQAETYVRDVRHLFFWTFPDSRAAVTAALEAPHDPAATRALCRALYRDWRNARALPGYLVGRPMRIAELRLLFACECRLYRRQAASANAQRGMASYLRHLASAAE